MGKDAFPNKSSWTFLPHNTELEELFDNLTYNFLLEDSIFRKSDF